jgi:SAM-dependent methyltransferase
MNESPTHPPLDGTGRFTDRVDDYVRGRPGYPPELLDTLREAGALREGDRVADLGAGTGISSRLFLDRGFAVTGVEPDAAMRAAADARLAGYPGWRSVEGRAEATGLAAASVDLAVAFQAFHWFDLPATARELDRILAPGGRIALVWNARRATGTPMLEAWEALLQRHGRDYAEVGHRGVPADRLRALFGGAWRQARLANSQRLDLAGLRARLLSSSYVPRLGEPGAEAMLADLEALFAAHQQGGSVRLDYDVDLFWGERPRRDGATG